jgi:hypothetical protein
VGHSQKADDYGKVEINSNLTTELDDSHPALEGVSVYACQHATMGE